MTFRQNPVYFVLPPFTFPILSPMTQLSALDCRISISLNQNARWASITIARQLDVPERTVRYRITSQQN